MWAQTEKKIIQLEAENARIKRNIRKAARMAVTLEGAVQHLDKQVTFVDSRKEHSRTQHGSVIEITARDQHG